MLTHTGSLEIYEAVAGKDTHILIPGTWEDAPSRGEGTCRLQVELKSLIS